MEKHNLDALIATNISDLEAAFTYVDDKIDPKLNAAAWDTLKRALGKEDFYFHDDEDPDKAWFAPTGWLDENRDSDPWFRLSARDGSDLYSWLACFVSPITERQAIGIQWYYNCLYVKDFVGVLENNQDSLLRIDQSGFRRDGNYIYLPIEFEQDKVAEGLAAGDLTEALEPIAVAAVAFIDAMPAFSKIRDAMIAKADT